jgi:8-oxo-dGTP pyrophosphatase MutT (NUDIX family)
MPKSLVKLSVIRKEDADPCPFGLSIPFGCKHAGDIINNMAPLTMAGEGAAPEDREKIAKANKKLYTWRIMESAEKPQPCRYASSIMEGQEAVQCNYTDTAPGVGPAPFLGSPFYSRVMSGVGLDGLYSVPLGYYADYNISRNLYYGIYSIQANANPELVKLAKETNKDTARGACVLFYCPEDSSVLLLKRSEKVNDGNTWGLPGGHIEKGEMPTQAAAREIYEEMGFIPDSGDILSSGHTEFHGKDVCIVFVTAVSKEVKEKWNDKIKLNWEHDGYEWFKTSNIPDELHPVAEFILSNSANIQE